MASTTLNTFMLPPPPFPVRSVEMKGSWDNFSQSYQLRSDGHTGHWRGCHAFENIVCDGVTIDNDSCRDGGLKMGGTYWYFYVLRTIDGELEYFNPIEPSTQLCPLLPGQTVNILEVPVQTNLVAGRNVSSSSIDSMVFTLDPRDKYLPPGVKRAATTSAIKKQKARLSNLSKGVSTSVSPPKTSASLRRDQTVQPEQRSLMSIFQKMRQTRSAGSNAKSTLGWPRKIFSRAGKAAKPHPSDDIPDVPKLPSQVPDLPAMRIKDISDLPMQEPRAAHCTDAQSTTEPPLAPFEAAVVPLPDQDRPLGEDHVQVKSAQASTLTPQSPAPIEAAGNLPSSHLSSVEQITMGDAYVSRPSRSPNTDHLDSRSASQHLESNPREHRKKPLTFAAVSSPNKTASIDELHRTEEDLHEKLEPGAAVRTLRDSAVFSSTASDDFSPYCASNTTRSDPMSPLHLSQPETPSMSEFGDEVMFLRPESEDNRSPYSQLSSDLMNALEITAANPPSRAPPPPPAPAKKPTTARSIFGNFQGYSLPEDDAASILTIRKPPSTHFLGKTADKTSPLSPQGHSKDLVNSWKDGSEYFLDDLGYLGEMIN